MTKDQKIELIQSKLQQKANSIMLSDVMKKLPYHIDISGLAWAWHLKKDSVSYITDQEESVLDLILSLYEQNKI